ncbi:uncharacterized protein MELLADRAFT_70543 [Melampsora larici-populina 98AG31]|uniref:Uncharacterized protein n=1 Tax=Melampsora larici-populina (strain 98AG31 / pathotype 3-4-7) TaxID=747676 RepID=F4R4R2_MELLP|nr:uncharacterized protein MELLADRAFT_70543 [Melampsora larici-populina 98AG31]EGG12853.1 hypothetical protein MELLADRAFT_70543 [Melampsora larici-populina 98AG31]
MTTYLTSSTSRHAKQTVSVSSASVSSVTPTATHIASTSPTTSSHPTIPSNRPTSYSIPVSGSLGTKTSLGLPVNSIQIVFGPATPTATAKSTKDLTSASHFGPVAITFLVLGVLLALIGLSVIVLLLRIQKSRRRDAHDFSDVSSNNPASEPASLYEASEPASLYENPNELQVDRTSFRASTPRQVFYLADCNRASSFISSPAQSFDITRLSTRYVHKSARSSAMTLRVDGPVYEPSYRLSSDTCMVMDPLMMKKTIPPQNASNHSSFMSDNSLYGTLAHRSAARVSIPPLPQARPKLSMIKHLNQGIRRSISNMSHASTRKVSGIAQDIPALPAEVFQDRP